MMKWSVVAAIILTANGASALSLKPMTHAEIIADAEAVIEGRIVRIHVPRSGKKDGTAVAEVVVRRSFKGPVADGATINLLYWSERQAGRHPWSSPWKYAVGWTGCLALRKKTSRSYRGYRKPARARRAKWVHWGVHYRGLIAAPEFREAARAWRDPIAHLSHPTRRGAALYFLTVKRQVNVGQLRTFLRSKRASDVLAGCRAAEVSKVRGVIGDLVNLALGNRWPSEGLRDNHNEARLASKLGKAIRAMDLDPVRDRKQLNRLLFGKPATNRAKKWMAFYMSWRALAFKLLRAGEARTYFTAALERNLKKRVTPYGINILHRLDARRAAPLIPKTGFPTSRLGKRGYDPMFVDDIAKHRHWTAFSVRSSRYRALPRGLLKRLRKAIATGVVRSPTVVAKAPTAWLVDIHHKLNWKGFETFPRVQLWVARDGTFGASWQPTMVWGRSSQLVKLLQKAIGK